MNDLYYKKQLEDYKKEDWDILASLPKYVDPNVIIAQLNQTIVRLARENRTLRQQLSEQVDQNLKHATVMHNMIVRSCMKGTNPETFLSEEDKT
jgi:hypothetical protein